MKIYNPFKREYYTSSFSTENLDIRYDKLNYNKKVETVFIKENKCIFVINDEEAGKKIYKIIEYLKNSKVDIYTKDATFRIIKTVTNFEYDRILAFYVKFKSKNIYNKTERINIKHDDDYNLEDILSTAFENEWEFKRITKIEKIVELVSLIGSLQKCGYYFSSSDFDISSCDSISGILSNLHEGGNSDDSKGCVIKLIHYILSKKSDFDSDYAKIAENEFINLLDLKYPFSIFKMCYEFYKYKKIPKSITKVLESALGDTNYSFLGTFYKPSKFALKVLKTKEYYSELALGDISGTFFNEENNKKTCLVNTKKFGEFLENNISYIKEYTGIKIHSIIYSLDRNVIGYRYFVEDNDMDNNINNILDIKFNKQLELIQLLKHISDKILTMNETLSISNVVEGDINIEEYIKLNKDNRTFKFKSVEKLFKITELSIKNLSDAVVTLFLKLYNKYIEENYGKLNSEIELFKKDEIRFLPPIVAREYINYVFGNKVNYNELKKSLLNYFNTYKISEKNEFIACDPRFVYDLPHIKFTFDYELEDFKKASENNKIVILSDGKKFIRLNERERISTIISIEKANRINLHDIFNDPEYYNKIKFIGVQEIVYSKEILKNGMYKAIGYVTESEKGEALTNEKIMQLSNRDFVYLVANILSNFNLKNIELNLINIDNNMNCYINLVKNKITIRKGSTKKLFTLSILDNLKGEGYDISKFENIDFSLNSKELIKIADSMDSFCNKHKLYYSSKLQGLCNICSKTLFNISNLSNKDYGKAIYEDEYAFHYKIDEKYNLKLYKQNNLDMALLEEQIDKIIVRNYDENRILYKQNLFIPIKKAINLNGNKFVGYLYNRVEFENKDSKYDICIDLKEFKNMPKLKGCIRLIEQLNGKVFLYNPFGSVFLSKEHKKQVQLTNPEFMVDDNYSYMNSDFFVRKYLENIINTDSSIKFDITKYLGLNNIKIQLEDVCNKLTRYCSIHKMYYSNNYIFCPECVDLEKQKSIDSHSLHVTKKQIKKWTKLNEGGEAIIYDYTDGIVAKVFKEDINIDFKTSIITRILEKKEILNLINKDQYKAKYIFPQRLLIDQRTNRIIRLYYEKD